MTADGPVEGMVWVRLPAEPPVLTPAAARALLVILVDLTEIEAPERPSDEGVRDGS